MKSAKTLIEESKKVRLTPAQRRQLAKHVADEVFTYLMETRPLPGVVMAQGKKRLSKVTPKRSA